MPRVDRGGLVRAHAATVELFPASPNRVSLALVGDRRMSEVHERHSGVPGTTDVLSFDLRAPGPAPVYEAEIVIGVEVAVREAKKRQLDFQREVELYLIHGLLHVAGFDDHNRPDRLAMRAAERRVLKMCGWP